MTKAGFDAIHEGKRSGRWHDGMDICGCSFDPLTRIGIAVSAGRW